MLRSRPFQRTTEALTKFVPFTVRVKAEPPAVAEEGLRLVMPGTGLAAVMLKVIVFEDSPPGEELNTVTLAVPAVAMSEASIAAVN